MNVQKVFVRKLFPAIKFICLPYPTTDYAIHYPLLIPSFRPQSIAPFRSAAEEPLLRR